MFLKISKNNRKTNLLLLVVILTVIFIPILIAIIAHFKH